MTDFFIGLVKEVKPEERLEWISGMGKDAIFKKVEAGVRVLLDTGVSFIMSSEEQVKVGDNAFVKFRSPVK